MTLPSSGPIDVAAVNTELGLSPTHSSSLSFLTTFMKTPPAHPHMGAFYGLAYYQNNDASNCNNGNCSNQNGPNGNCTPQLNCGNGNCSNAGGPNGNCSDQGGPNGNCTSNCNCGNIQCTNCVIVSPSDCANCAVCTPSDCANCQVCSAINCSNCTVCVQSDCANCQVCNNINCQGGDTQKYLQPNWNCNGGPFNCTTNPLDVNCNYTGGITVNCNESGVSYNCNTSAVSYNCNTGAVSYNCNCACNCSKIVCAKLYEFGMMSPDIWAADQAYGKWLRKTDKRVYRGYIKWARIVTAWMDGNGPAFMPWIRDPEERARAQRTAMTTMAQKIGTPWSEHMAYLMGTLKTDNTMGRMLMNIGRPICRLVSYIPRSRKASKRHGLVTVWTIWACLYFSYYTALALTKIISAFSLAPNKSKITAR